MNPISLIGNLFHEVFFRPIVNILVIILEQLQLLGIPGSLGWSVILLTLIIRLLVWPFIALANAIPMLFDANQLQKVNDLLYFPNLKLIAPPDPHFAGFSLGDKLIDKTPFVGEWWVLMLIPIITMALSFIQSKMMLPVKPLQVRKEDSKVAIKEKEGVEDTMGAMQSQMMFMMPLMIGVFSYQFPVGLSLYWNIFTLVGIIQQYLIAGWGGFAPWIKIIRR